jgi:hypothetical protein
MNNIQIEIPKGIIKTIGQLGPIYEVGEPIEQLENGDWLVEITLVESGEITEYNLSDIKNDPEAE